MSKGTGADGVHCMSKVKTPGVIIAKNSFLVT